VEDANQHLRIFVEICIPFKMRNMSQEFVQLGFFSFLIYQISYHMSLKITLRVDYCTYVREVFHLHGVPVSIISNRAFQFTPTFRRALQEELGTPVDLITTFHIQTDGKSECTFQVLKDMF